MLYVQPPPKLPFGVACLDAAVWVALLDDVERRESGFCSLEV